MSDPLPLISLNGKVLSSQDAGVSPAGSAFYYGTGCFETFRIENGRFFRFDDHLLRLNEGIAYLTGSADYSVSSGELRSEITQLLKASRLEDQLARVRVQVSVHEPGYSASEHPDRIRLITAKPLKISSEPVNLVTVLTRAVPSVCRPAHLKLSNMLHYRQAWRDARSRGADDALLLTINGNMAETSIANLFWKTGNRIFTPSEECDILPGVMRNVVIDLISDQFGLEVKEGRFSPDSLKNAEVAWTTNSVQEIREISSLDGHELRRDLQFIERLGKELQRLKRREMK
jgi:branched-subunit amino acid aminotransferase/4-amino-4-deoxychorismate lyase